MLVIKLYIISTLIGLNYANLFGDIFYKEPEKIQESHLLEKLQGILIQSSETYQKAKDKIKTASGLAKQLPEFLDYPHQLINDAWSKLQHFFNKPAEIIKQLEDSLKIAKDLAEITDESLEKLFEILTKTKEITMILQEISQQHINNITDDINEAVHIPCEIKDGIKDGIELVTKEIIDELTEKITEGIIGEMREEATEEEPMTQITQDKDITQENTESTTKEPVIFSGDKPHHGSHHGTHHGTHHKPHKPLESELCNCEICSCEKSCRPSKGEAIQYIPCHGGNVCCIKKPTSGPYSTMAWETALQLAMDHLHNNLDNMD